MDIKFFRAKRVLMIINGSLMDINVFKKSSAKRDVNIRIKVGYRPFAKKTETRERREKEKAQ